MPSLDVAYASAIQAAYTIGVRNGMDVALDHLPPAIKETAAQAMLADGSSHSAWVDDETLDEISRVQGDIVTALEAVEAGKN
jgi:hypothetical protein